MCYTASMMDLSAAGLTPTEAKCYAALLEKREWKPADLAKSVNETRTNCYKILDNLVELGLAERFDKDKKLHYRAMSPMRLIELSRSRRSEFEASEKVLELQAANFFSEYIKNHDQPGVRFVEGQSGIKEIFQEIAKASEPVRFIHTKKGIDFYGFDTMHNLRMLAVAAGVRRKALTVDDPVAPKDYQHTDPEVLLERTWLKQNDYTAPVEWGVFDDTLYVISYGSEAMGMIVQSKQIAESFKQIFDLLDRDQRALPGYDTLPKHAQAKGVTKPLP